MIRGKENGGNSPKGIKTLSFPIAKGPALSENISIWVLADDRAGNVSQCLGVAEALGLPFEIKNIAYGAMGKLPNFLLGSSLRALTKESAEKICAPWPGLVLAAGRRTAPIARYIKKKNAGKTKIVQIMHPGSTGAGDFDMICVPEHDGKILAANEFAMFGAPHRVTETKLSQARKDWAERLEHLAHPRIGLIVGGATKNKVFNREMALDLAREINRLAQEHSGSVLVTTSRRTGDVADDLMDEISVPSFKFKWGDEGENPYFGFLALSDHLIVTGDSVSMCSEACATGKPVYIYAPDGMISEKHQRMVNSLCDKGYAKLFDGNLTDEKLLQLQTAQDIVIELKRRLDLGL